jgi:hypothetical protein
MKVQAHNVQFNIMEPVESENSLLGQESETDSLRSTFDNISKTVNKLIKIVIKKHTTNVSLSIKFNNL